MRIALVLFSFGSLALLGCTSESDGPMCGPGTVRAGDECVLARDGAVPADAGAIVDGSPGPTDAPTGTTDAPPGATDGGPRPDAPSTASCGDGTCEPARAGDDLADVEGCTTCAADCSSSCGTHQCSWVFYCAREMLCTDVVCVAGCLPEGDADAQRQYLDLYACMEDRCADMCFNGHLGGECTSCVCSECPTQAAGCGGLSCT